MPLRAARARTSSHQVVEVPGGLAVLPAGILVQESDPSHDPSALRQDIQLPFLPQGGKVGEGIFGQVAFVVPLPDSHLVHPMNPRLDQL